MHGLTPHLPTKVHEVYLTPPMSTCIVCHQPSGRKLLKRPRVDGYVYDLDGVHSAQFHTWACLGKLCNSSYWAVCIQPFTHRNRSLIFPSVRAFRLWDILPAILLYIKGFQIVLHQWSGCPPDFFFFRFTVTLACLTNLQSPSVNPKCLHSELNPSLPEVGLGGG